MNNEIHDEGKFSDVKKLSDYKQTEFLPTLEHGISTDKNAIYCSTFLLAWDEIRGQVGQPIVIENGLADLNMVNNSRSFAKSLHPFEFSSGANVDDEIVEARAEFSKSLPFEIKLTSFKDQLNFGGKKVASFGQEGYNDAYPEIIQIIYYKDDDDFIIKVSTKEKGHEIILFKSKDTYSHLSDILSVITHKSELGKKEKKLEKNFWRYAMTDEDEVIIPKIKFNIETNYPSLAGKTFKAGNQKYFIETAYQRTAFILDESGAEIESEAAISAAMHEGTKPHPKKMRFDKPFFVLLKRTDCNNPYFVMWTCNTELMVLE